MAGSHVGDPGGSAWREYEHRRRRDRSRARKHLPLRLVLASVVAASGYLGVQLVVKLIGGVSLLHDTSARPGLLTATTAHALGAVVAFMSAAAVTRSLWMKRPATSAWATGARGERIVGAHLAKVRSHDVAVMHDRRIPGSRANIDHIAVGPGGIFVIDAKVASGRVSLRRTGPIWDRGPLRLFVGDRDRNAFIEGMQDQVDAVAHALSTVPEADGVRIRPLVVLVGGDRRWRTRPVQLAGVWIGAPREMAKVLNRSGPLSRETTERLARTLAMRLPAA